MRRVETGVELESAAAFLDDRVPVVFLETVHRRKGDVRLGQIGIELKGATGLLTGDVRFLPPGIALGGESGR